MKEKLILLDMKEKVERLIILIKTVMKIIKYMKQKILKRKEKLLLIYQAIKTVIINTIIPLIQIYQTKGHFL